MSSGSFQDQSEEPEDAATTSPSGEPQRKARTQLPRRLQPALWQGLGVPLLDSGDMKATWPGVRCGTGLLPGGCAGTLGVEGCR